MFGNLGNLGQMKDQMEAVKTKLASIEVTGEARSGAVQVIMNGNMELKDVIISNELMNLEFKEELQDLIVVAINAANQKATELNQKEMKIAANDLFPGLGGMLG